MRVQVKEFLVKIHKDAYDFRVTKRTIQKFNFDPYLKWIAIDFIKAKFKNE